MIDPDDCEDAARGREHRRAQVWLEAENGSKDLGGLGGVERRSIRS